MQIRSRATKAGMLGAAALTALALSDGQSVTVTGSGFPAGTQVAVSQCREDTTCTDTLATATVGADGGFTAAYTVRKRFAATDWSTGTGTPVTVDCATAQCRLVAYQDATGPVGTDISFG